jgi:hypothetical protein
VASIQVNVGSVIQLQVSSDGRGAVSRIDFTRCPENYTHRALKAPIPSPYLKAYPCPLKHLDFEGLSRGQYIHDELKESFGVVITATAARGGYIPGGAARVFNTSDTGGKYDLGSPNESCGGPGKGIGGRQGSAYENCEPLGNVLIIQESNTLTPEGNAGGGTINFDFVHPANVREIAILDIDDNEIVQVQVMKSDGSIEDILTESTGDNGVYRLRLAVDMATQVKVIFPSSGAVAYLNYEMCVLPLPS